MKNSVFEILTNAPLTKDVYRMTLSGDVGDVVPGQFVDIQLDGGYLRRPISVCDAEKGVLTLIYKKVGRGTEEMASCKAGKRLDLLTCLGNGYDLSPCGDKPLLIGGGVGVPPLYMLAKALIKQGKDVGVILGFNTSDEIFYEKEFASLGARVAITTLDGSRGTKGFVTDALGLFDYTYVYSCGPKPMLKAVCDKIKTGGQFSLEERMGCGFGACMGCSVRTANGYKRLCKDGPVLYKEEILW